jgi:TonB-linked SusC/RagA family outer membrane protein
MASASTGLVEEKVKLKLGKTTYQKLFAEIQKQTGLVVMYGSQVLDKNAKVDGNLGELCVKEALDKLVSEAGLRYKMESGYVVLMKAEPINVKQQKRYKVSGQVVDEKNIAIPGANVILDGTSIGTITNVDGIFKLELTKQSGILTVSFIGFKLKKVNFKAGDDIKIKLEEDVSALEEVQIVAYGEQKKKLVSGAVASVKSESLENVPSADLASLLQGKVAGLSIQNIGGAPGAAKVQTTLRGYNDLLSSSGVGANPLWVVDGIPMEDMENSTSGTNFLSEIDPNMIESIEVLKDASAAALYGSRAGNGVILVTTKSGKKGRTRLSANFSYSHSYRQQAPPVYAGTYQRKYYEFLNRNLKPAYYNSTTGEVGYVDGYKDAYDKLYSQGGSSLRDLIYDGFWGSGRSSDYQGSPLYQDSLNTYYNNATNWYDAYDENGSIINANIQASGGSDRVLYNIGLAYYDEKGIVINTGYKRANLVSNFTVSPANKLKIILRNNLSYTQLESNGTDPGSIDPSLLNTSPYLPGPGSNFYQSRTDAAFGQNTDNEGFSVRTSMTFQYNIIENLNFTSRNAFVLSYNNTHNFKNPSYSPYNESTISDNIGITRNMMTENMLNYKFKLNDKHSFDILTGVTYEQQIAKSYHSNVTGGSNDYVQWVTNTWPDWINRGTDDKPQIVAYKDFNSNKVDAITIGYIGRVNYNYKEKYMASFSLRRDGSSKFGKARPWGTFPAASIGWIVTEENFMATAPYFDFLKLRASYGSSGSTYKQAYLAYGTYMNGGIFNNIPTTNLASQYNPDLTWEKTTQFNIGFDTDLLNYRLGLTFDYYLKDTKDMILPVDNPGNHNLLENVMRNSAGIRNTGIEFSMKFDILRDGDFKYKLNANFARNWNKLLETYDGRDYNGKIVGKPVLGLWALEKVDVADTYDDIPYWYNNDGNKQYIQAGYKPFQPGDMLYVDQNGDNKITSKDVVYMGSSLPEIVGGFVHEFRYENWDLSIYMNYSLGRKGFESLSTGGLSPNAFRMDAPLRVDPTGADFWTPENTDSKLPSYLSKGSQYNYGSLSTDEVINLDYLKIKTITLSYNFDKKTCQKIGMSGLKAFFTADNVYSFHDLPKYIDPESISPQQNTYTFGNYPFATKLTLGITANF